MTRFFSPLAAGLTAVALLVMTGVTDTPSASAHERRTVADKYIFVVGFDVEPVFLEQKNAALLRVTDAQTNQPVEGVEQTLKVEISNSGQSKMFDLKTRRNEPGTYIADLVPTKGGSWVFRFQGTIAGTPINETFESGPGRFNEPQPLSELEFPVQVPSNSQLAQAIQGTSQSGEAAPNATSSTEVQEALDRADDARQMSILLGGGGLVVGLLGLGVAAFALTRRSSGPAEPRSVEPV